MIRALRGPGDTVVRGGDGLKRIGTPDHCVFGDDTPHLVDMARCPGRVCDATGREHDGIS